MDNNISEIIEKKMSKKKKWGIIFFVSFFILFVLSAPFNSNDIIIHIRDGQSIDSLTQELHNKNVIRNEFFFKFFIKIVKSGQGVISGDYLIIKNSPVWVVAWQVGRGYHNIEPIKITIREGLTNVEIANILSSKLIDFDKNSFLNGIEGRQGYLFPDTYYIYGMDTPDEIIEKLSNNFKNKINKINTSLIESGKTLSDVVVMASILEWEAGGKGDIGIISGILWRRISIGMPLQVDIDKTTYNTKGFPVIPLNNPGLLSIEAAISPISSSYLYYLHDKNGNVHYANTFEEHKLNIKDYLK